MSFRSLRVPAAIAVLVVAAAVACQDQTPVAPDVPVPGDSGFAAFVTVDNLEARPGQTVRIRVELNGAENAGARVGSYTGRLRFDPARLAFQAEQRVNDGLRVANNNNAAGGELRFAGASPQGFESLVLYDATFEVRQLNFREGLVLTMEELSAAHSLSNLAPRLQVNRQVFVHRAR